MVEVCGMAPTVACGHPHLLCPGRCSSAEVPFSVGGEDPCQVDGAGGHRLPQVHLGQRRLELWHRHVGGDVVRGEALLGHVQPRRKHWGSSTPLWGPGGAHSQKKSLPEGLSAPSWSLGSTRFGDETGW